MSRILYEDPHSIRYRLRSRRFAKVAQMVEELASSAGTVRILDLGGTRRYWEILGEPIEKFSHHVTILNRERVSTAGPADDRFTIVAGDACDVHFSDNSFDLIHSNSLIEHVGDWGRMVAAGEEIRRLAPSYYVQVPYFWLPYEPHFQTLFFHWLPEQVRARLLMRFALGHYEKCSTMTQAMNFVQSARLLDKAQIAELLPDAETTFEKVLGVPKSIIAIRHGIPYDSGA